MITITILKTPIDTKKTTTSNNTTLLQYSDGRNSFTIKVPPEKLINLVNFIDEEKYSVDTYTLSDKYKILDSGVRDGLYTSYRITHNSNIISVNHDKIMWEVIGPIERMAGYVELKKEGKNITTDLSNIYEEQYKQVEIIK